MAIVFKGPVLFTTSKTEEGVANTFLIVQSRNKPGFFILSSLVSREVYTDIKNMFL
jgi:hypothetical protein